MNKVNTETRLVMVYARPGTVAEDCEDSPYMLERGECPKCGVVQIALHPMCERFQCVSCGYMIQSEPLEPEWADPD